jgi:hypothetical protein
VEDVGELVSAAAVPATDVSWPFRPSEAANVPEADLEMVAVEGEVTALVVEPEEAEAPANDNQPKEHKPSIEQKLHKFPYL